MDHRVTPLGDGGPVMTRGGRSARGILRAARVAVIAAAHPRRNLQHFVTDAACL
jgi:hypothetical protein